MTIEICTRPRMQAIEIKPAVEALNWVHKAVSKDKMRRELTGIFFDDTCAICTDGHRMHIWFHYGFMELRGVYEVLQISKKLVTLRYMDVEYPKYEKLFASYMPPRDTTVYAGKPYQLVWNIYTEHNICVNSTFVHEAFIEDKWTIQSFGKTKPVFMATEEYLAIIMPIKEK